MPTKKKGRADLSISQLISLQDGETCVFCLSNEDKEEEYGKFIKKCGLQVHYFCMLFASGLCQRGKSEEHGIYGFLPEDIIKEIRRGSRLKCYCCKKKGSTIGCVVGSCSKKFHLGCGRKGGTLHQFFGSFRSFCQDHRPRQMVPISDRLAFYGTANALCAICMNSVEARASNETLRAPCCRNSWFHRSCIQKHASTAGLYFFKCPLCNNKEMFQNEMLEFGIHIPDQDAAWETEPNAYNELMERYMHCDALLCRCPNGRKYNRDGGKWEITTCDWCGSKGTHVACHSLIKIGRNLVCQECKEIDDRSRKIQKIKKKKRTPLKKRLLDNVEDKDDIDLEQKAKSEYPGPSSAIVKTNPTKKKTPDVPRNRSPVGSPGMSPGNVLRLEYQETDDDVDVVEDEDVNTCLSPLLSAQKENRSRNIPAATGSCEQKQKRRGRSRHRKRSRSSSSEYIPLSSIRHRLRSSSRGPTRHSRSRSRSLSEESHASGDLSHSPRGKRFSRRRMTNRSRSSSSDSLVNSRLRSASRKRKRSRSSSSESLVHKRLRSASRGRPREKKSSSSLESPGFSRTRSVSRKRKIIESPSKTASSKQNSKKTLAYDEVDGEILPVRPSSESKKRRKSVNHPFSAHGYKNKKRRKPKVKRMLISMEPELSYLSPVAQYQYGPDVITGSSEDSDIPLKEFTPKISQLEYGPSDIPVKVSSPKKSTAKPGGKEMTNTFELSSASSKIGSKQEKWTYSVELSSTKSQIKSRGKVSENISEEFKEGKLFSTNGKIQKVNGQLLMGSKKESMSPQKGSNKLNMSRSPKSGKQMKKTYKKRNKIDSKQMLINQWLKSSKDCRLDDKENNHNKFLTIKWQGNQYILMKTHEQNGNCLSTISPYICKSRQPSPNARASQLREERQPSPNTRASKVKEDILQNTNIGGLKLRDGMQQSPTTRSSQLRTGSPITRASKSPQPSPIINQTPRSLLTEDILQKISEKKSSLMKTYPLRFSNKPENGNVRCSLSTKFVDGESVKDSYPVIQSILNDQVTLKSSPKASRVTPSKMNSPVNHPVVEELNSSGSSDTLSYMDEDFLTSDDSDNKEPSEIETKYVIKRYDNVNGLEQVQVVLPSS
ncbi:uncharacterized protein LOC143068936 isoform X2 [Mytilus galloprovincialis]|uniref:uncharacterized protein LOC143068936 isoform X2 n=1 Tax=Mytilus galloprovincialis TaxID=29158 RepID=UPI003F7B6E58